MKDRNLTLLTDLYELTMLYGYHRHGMASLKASFYMFFRAAPGLNYAVMAGNQQLKEYLLSLRFHEQDLSYLDSLHLFDRAFLERLKDFRFTGDIRLMPEGSFIFPD